MKKSDLDRQALIDQTVEQFRKQLQQNLPDEEATLDQIEEITGKIGDELIRDLQQRLLNQRTKKPRDNHIACPCGSQARYRLMSSKTLLSRQGLLSWTRPYYRCDRCGRGTTPLDASLKLDKGETTTGVREWVVQLAPHLGFVLTAHTLRRLCRIDLSAATVERIAVACGHSLHQAQLAEAHLHRNDRLSDVRTACPRRLYIEADGVMTPLREAWHKDGSLGALVCRYGECKTGVVFETHRDPDGKDRRVHTRAYTATLAGVEAFELQLGLVAHRCGHHAAQEIVVLGDGAAWIWLMFARLFPGALQILDFYHACEHLAHVADAIYGQDTDLSRAWQKARQSELKHNQVGQVLGAIAAWKPKRAADHQLRRAEFGYFRHNAARMRYQTYLESGYHIGSGVVEAACKQVVAQRLDQVGMHWRCETAEAIVALRAAQLCTHPPDLRPHLVMAA